MMSLKNASLFLLTFVTGVPQAAVAVEYFVVECMNFNDGNCISSSQMGTFKGCMENAAADLYSKYGGQCPYRRALEEEEEQRGNSPCLFEVPWKPRRPKTK